MIEKSLYNKFNYLIIGEEGGFYDIAYHDLFGLDNVRYYAGPYDRIENKLIKGLIRLNLSSKVNKLLPYPFGWLVNQKICPTTFGKKKPLCVIFFSRNYNLLNSSYLDYLKSRNKNIKIVVYFHDLLKTHRGLDVAKLKEKTDLVLTYDQRDEKEYGFIYYPTPFSYIEIDDKYNNTESDFYFCGWAKDRYKQIFDIVEVLKEKKAIMDINLFGVPSSERLFTDVINYDNKITYYENLVHVKRTKCIIEILQKDAEGFTPRLWESIMYDKFLLTNSMSIIGSRFENLNGVYLVNNMNAGVIETIKKKKIHYDYTLKRSLSPLCLLQFIQDRLTEIR